MWRGFTLFLCMFLGAISGAAFIPGPTVTTSDIQSQQRIELQESLPYMTTSATTLYAPVSHVEMSSKDINQRLTGMLLHMRWLLADRMKDQDAELTRINKQIYSNMDDDDDNDDGDDELPSTFVINNLGAVTSGSWQAGTIADAYIANILTLDSGTVFADDLLTPDSLLTVGQSDEYCLTYETTGTTFEWQTCGAGSLSTTDIDTSAELASVLLDETGSGSAVFSVSPTFTGTITAADANFSGNVGIGTTTPNQKLTVQGNINLSSATGAIYFDDTKFFYASTTNDSIVIGEDAGSLFNSNTSLNIALGFNAARYASTSDSDNSIYIGAWAGQFDRGGYNILIGDGSGGENAGFDNQILGYYSGYYNTGNRNNIMGYLAADTNSGDENNIFGVRAGYSNTGDFNNLLGTNAGRENTGNYNNIFGFEAGYNNTGAYNNILGMYAGYNNTGSNNNFIGQSAGNSNSGSYNTFMGERAGHSNVGDFNIAMGYYAGYYNNGDNNQFFGDYSGYLLRATSTIAFGTESMRGTGFYNAINNVALGYRAGYVAATGADNNILIGYQAADNLTTGNNNIIIGYNIDNVTATADNRLNIGNLIFGTGLDGTGTTLSSGNVGIGTTSPNQRLSIFTSGGDAAIEFSSMSGAGKKWSIGIDDSDGAKFKISSSSALGTNDRFVIDGMGRVGIGTSSPSAQFALEKNHAADTEIVLKNTNSAGVAKFTIMGDSGNATTLFTGNTAHAYTQYRGSGVLNSTDGLVFVTDAGVNGGGTNSISFLTGGFNPNTQTRMFIDSTGNIGIGTTSPAQKLQVVGDIRVGTTGSNGCIENFGGGLIGGTCSSDEQLKSDITPLETNASSTRFVEALAALTPVSYNWNTKAARLYSKNVTMENIGLIAQDVEEQFPELVSRNKDGYLQVNFEAFPFYMMQALKELWVKVKGHDERLEQLEEENELLKERLHDIENELNTDDPSPSEQQPETSVDTTPETPTEEPAPPVEETIEVAEPIEETVLETAAVEPSI